MATFKAIVITKTDGSTAAALTDFDDAALMEGDVTLRPQWSTVNYKDGLAITGKGPVVRRFPMIAGVDAAAVVEASTHPGWKAGDEVILNGFDPRHILGGDAQRRALLLIEDDAIQIDDPVLDGDRDTVAWDPGGSRQFGEDALADLLVTRRGGRFCCERAGEAAQQVGTAEDADRGVAIEHRHPLDAVAFHQLDDFLERCVRGHADRVAGHDLADLAPMGSNIFLREPAGTHQKL